MTAFGYDITIANQLWEVIRPLLLFGIGGFVGFIFHKKFYKKKNG